MFCDKSNKIATFDFAWCFAKNQTKLLLWIDFAWCFATNQTKLLLLIDFVWCFATNQTKLLLLFDFAWCFRCFLLMLLRFLQLFILVYNFSAVFRAPKKFMKLVQTKIILIKINTVLIILLFLKYLRVWSWLRVNAIYLLNTCKLNVLFFEIKVANGWVIQKKIHFIVSYFFNA